MFDGLSSFLRGQSIEIDLRTVTAALPFEARDDPVGSKICPASAKPFRSTMEISQSGNTAQSAVRETVARSRQRAG
jgi:hypothetical protein